MTVEARSQPQHKLRAVFMRGGTSNALMIRQGDLSADRGQWDRVFLAALGSPDPFGRQLDGMGGGISSLSKVCVIGAPTRPDADVDYTFAQVAVDEPVVDYAGNCGNMSSAVGPFALDERLVEPPADGGDATVRIHNTNTSTLIVARFPTDHGFAAVVGDAVVDGVAGTAAPVRLDFMEPAGGKTGQLLPTGHAVDLLAVDGVGEIPASMVDVANPCVFVSAESLHMNGSELPADIEARPDLLAALERLRCHASVAMGLTDDLDAATEIPSIPKIAVVSPSGDSMTLTGEETAREHVDLTIRMISMGRPHRAVPVTGALCLAASCRIGGSVPYQVLGRQQSEGDRPIRVGHPSGVLPVDALVTSTTGEPYVVSASVYRTARRLFEGHVLYRAV